MSKDQILLVDDNDGQRITLESILKRAGFKVTTADCGNNAIQESEREEFAAVLLDIKMPDITGIDVLKVIKTNHPDTCVIMMTGYSETDYAINALNAGATAYLLKPANIEQIKMMLKQAIEHQRLIEENKAMSQALREWNEKLEKKVQERTGQLHEANKTTLSFYQDLKKNFESTLEVLSIAIDQRDPLTQSHSFRVTQFAIEVAKIMNLSEKDQEKLRYAGLMHDLGKIEVKENILCKEGSLTSNEYKEIQTHAHGTLSLLSKFKFKGGLKDVPEIAAGHHERFDGAGYPKGLKGEAIPLLARVLAVADVLDAITSKRHYRTAMSIKDALNIMRREAGGHFDPQCTQALFQIKSGDFIKIHRAENLSDVQPEDLIELSSFTLQQIHEACSVEKPNQDQLEALGRFYKYYMGPVPSHLEGKVKPNPKFEKAIQESN